MAWTNPKSWSVNELLTASLLNTHLRDNLLALKNPPTSLFSPVTDYATSSTAYVDIDTTNLSRTITTTGGDVLIGFFAPMNISNSASYYMVRLLRNGVSIGIVLRSNTATVHPAAFLLLNTPVAAGTWTYKLQWAVTGNGVQMYGASYTPQFWVREV